MITLETDRLTFRFPEVHPDAACSIDFQRTLRIPDDGSDYPLPPGLGSFPLRHVDDYADRLPAAWQRRGGVLLPMHQAEAMWLSFDCGAQRLPIRDQDRHRQDLRRHRRRLGRTTQPRPTGLPGRA